MKNRTNLYSPVGDPTLFGAGGGGNVEPSVEPTEEPSFESEIEPNEEPEPVAPQTLSREDLAAAFREGASQLIQSQQPQTPRQYTQEEIDKALNRWNPDDTFFERLTGPDATMEERRAAYSAMRDGLLREQYTITQALVESQMAKMQERFTPVLQQTEEATRTKSRQEFFSSYPTLQDERYTPFIEAAALQVSNTGKEYKTAKEVQAAVARQAELMIKKFDANFALKKATPAGVLPAAQRPGGGGGVGRTTTPATNLTPQGRALAALGVSTK